MMLSLKTNDSSPELMKKEQELFEHLAWHGLLIGAECEKLLRGRPTGSYLLRSGEARFHYYLSYVMEAPFIYKHQPFSITFEETKLGWGYLNTHQWWAPKLEELIPLIIHQPAENCIPIFRHG